MQVICKEILGYWWLSGRKVYVYHIVVVFGLYIHHRQSILPHSSVLISELHIITTLNVLSIHSSSLSIHSSSL